MGTLSDYFVASKSELKSGVESADPVCHEESYEWFVLKVTPSLVDALVALSDSEAAKHGAKIAACEELGWPAKDGKAVLGDLRTLAQKARAAKKGLYLWVSV